MPKSKLLLIRTVLRSSTFASKIVINLLARNHLKIWFLNLLDLQHLSSKKQLLYFSLNSSIMLDSSLFLQLRILTRLIGLALKMLNHHTKREVLNHITKQGLIIKTVIYLKCQLNTLRITTKNGRRLKIYLKNSRSSQHLKKD